MDLKYSVCINILKIGPFINKNWILKLKTLNIIPSQRCLCRKIVAKLCKEFFIEYELEKKVQGKLYTILLQV